MPEQEAWTTTWAIKIDGRDMTSRMNPFVQSIEVSDRDGTASDTANITLDDSEARIAMPRDGGMVEVALEGVDVFKGTVDEIRSTGARGEGRILTVSAKGFDSRGKVKTPLDFHRDDVTLQVFLDDAARRAGLASIVVDPAFAAITRPYWSADGESFIHLTERLAREFGGTFKVRGDQAVLARRGFGMTPSGKPLPSVTGTYGENLLSWDISPFVGRPRGKKAKVKYFDRATATHKSVDVEIDPDAADATTIPVYTAADADSAGDVGRGKKSKADRDKGEGSVRLVLTPQIRVESTFTVVGIRPGIDGPYRVSGVQHSLSRASGSATTLELKQPGSGTGASGDKRTPAFDTEAFIAEQRSADQSVRDQVDPSAPAF